MIYSIVILIIVYIYIVNNPTYVGIYMVSSVDQEPKFTAHKQITNQYTSIITWLKPSKRETVHALSQRGHFREFINIKEKLHMFLS